MTAYASSYRFGNSPQARPDRLDLRSKALSRRALGQPILSAESNKGHVKYRLQWIGFEDDCDALAPTTMPDKPSFQWRSQSHSGVWIRHDIGQKGVDFIETAACRVKVTARRLDDMVDQCNKIAVDQRVTDQTHQGDLLRSACERLLR